MIRPFFMAMLGVLAAVVAMDVIITLCN
jgi:hypothetical protein